MITNLTKDNILAGESKVYSSTLSQAIGLMFSKKRKDFGLVLIFKKDKIISLHMFFVFYPIDVLFLDSEKRVVEMKENFKPFTDYTSKKRVKYVVELPSKTISETNTSLNDIISF